LQNTIHGHRYGEFVELLSSLARKMLSLFHVNYDSAPEFKKSRNGGKIKVDGAQPEISSRRGVLYDPSVEVVMLVPSI